MKVVGAALEQGAGPGCWPLPGRGPLSTLGVRAAAPGGAVTGPDSADHGVRGEGWWALVPCPSGHLRAGPMQGGDLVGRWLWGQVSLPGTPDKALLLFPKQTSQEDSAGECVPSGQACWCTGLFPHPQFGHLEMSLLFSGDASSAQFRACFSVLPPGPALPCLGSVAILLSLGVPLPLSLQTARSFPATPPPTPQDAPGRVHVPEGWYRAKLTHCWLLAEVGPARNQLLLQGPAHRVGAARMGGD